MKNSNAMKWERARDDKHRRKGRIHEGPSNSLWDKELKDVYLVHRKFETDVFVCGKHVF